MWSACPRWLSKQKHVLRDTCVCVSVTCCNNSSNIKSDNQEVQQPSERSTTMLHHPTKQILARQDDRVGERRQVTALDHIPLLARPSRSGQRLRSHGALACTPIAAHESAHSETSLSVSLSLSHTQTEIYTPGQDRTGDLQRVRLTS